MSLPFAAFHAPFVAALYGDTGCALSRQPGFAIYRNTVLKGCVDALQANFPVVCRLVGEQWFGEVAGRYARQHRPTDRSLLRYGADFPEFLQRFAQAADLPYLAGVARLDQAWLQCHAAADEPVLAPADLAAHWSGDPGALYLHPCAAARWHWFPAVPVYSIWDANRRAMREPQGEPEPLSPVWQGEGALLVRSAEEVTWMAIDEAGCAFLDGCRSGRSLLQAAMDSGLQDAALADLFARCLQAGVFVARTTN